MHMPLVTLSTELGKSHEFEGLGVNRAFDFHMTLNTDVLKIIPSKDAAVMTFASLVLRPEEPPPSTTTSRCTP